MSTTWDEPKRKANLAKHGYAFDACFDGKTALIQPTRPSKTGRRRYLLIGDWAGVQVAVVVVRRSAPRPCP